ncbi:MAG: hypothetical protein ACE5JX_19060, partial [Acidobacteriota bacterium]
RLSAQESRSIRFNIPPNSDSGAGPLRISVETEEDGSRLLATGWIEYGGGTAGVPIRFHTTRTEPSGELAGFFLGSDSRLLLWNLSD